MCPLRWSETVKREKQRKAVEDCDGISLNMAEYQTTGERFFHIFLSSPVFFIPLHSYPIAEAVACGSARAAMPLGGWGGTHT